MSFAQPLVLLVLIVPAVVGYLIWTRQGRRVALPFDHGGPGGRPWLRRGIATVEMLPPLLLAVVILLLAGPLRLDAPKSKRALTNIQFCLDVSGSMTAGFGDATRYDGAMAAINSFLDYRQGDAFGLTFFGNSVLHWVPLTSDVSAFRCAPPFMHPLRPQRPPWFGGTEIGKALMACRDVLVEREEGDRMIILISDGQSWDLEGDRAEQIARQFKDDRICVYGVHIADGDVPGPIVDITSRTGGEVFQPGDPDALQRVFERIDQMQETRLEKDTPEQVDDFWPLCVAGLGLLGAHLLAAFFARYTPW